METPLLLPESRVAGRRRIRDRILVVTLPAEPVGAAVVREVLLEGERPGEEAPRVRSVRGMAGAAIPFLDGGMDRRSLEGRRIVTEETEIGTILFQELFHIRGVGTVTAGARLPGKGGVDVRGTRYVIVAFAACLGDLGNAPPAGGIPVAGLAVPFQEGIVLKGVEERSVLRGVRVVALHTVRAAEGVAVVSRLDLFTLQIVASGAELLPAVEKYEPVLPAVVEMTGAAVPAFDGGVDDTCGEALYLLLVAAAAFPVDRPFESRGLGGGERGGGWRSLNLRGGGGYRPFGLTVPVVALRAVTAHVALAAVGKGPELKFEAGDAVAVERGSYQLWIGCRVDFVTVPACHAAVRRLPGVVFSPFDMDLMDVDPGFPEIRRVDGIGGEEGLSLMALEAEGEVPPVDDPAALGVISDEE